MEKDIVHILHIVPGAISSWRDEVLKSVHRLGFLPGKFYLENYDVLCNTTVLNERKHLKLVIRSVQDLVSLILGRTE